MLCKKQKYGEYVRYEGKIYKAIEKQKYDYNYRRYYIKIKNVIEKEVFVDAIEKHSKDIKDIIELGDYVNGCKVVEFFRDKLTGMVVIKTANQRKYYNSKTIRSLVTHEQFKNVEYKI